MRTHWMICLAAAALLAVSACSRAPETPQTEQTESAALPAVPEESAPANQLAPPPGGPPSAPARSQAARPASRTPAGSQAAVPGGAPARSVTPTAPAAPPPPPPVTVEAGTRLVVRTTNTLSTKDMKSGETFVATLEEDLQEGGRLIARKGANVQGRIVESDPGGRVKGVASLTLQLTGLELANGKHIDIVTGTVSRDAPKSTKKDALKLGVATGVGAAIGAIAGGGRGAAIGAGAGAAGGTGVVMATRGDPATVPAESVLTFTLRTPFTVQ